MSREETFEYDAADWQTVAKNLASLVRDVAGMLKEGRFEARTVTVKIRFEDFKTLTRAKTLESPADVLEVLRKVAFECLGRIEIKKRVRLVGVRATGLRPLTASPGEKGTSC